MKILIADKIADPGVDLLANDPDLDIEIKPGLDEDALCEAIEDAVGLIIRSGVKVTRRVIDSASRLKVIGRAGIGVDNIDVPYATERGIVVLNTPNANATTTAELAIAHIFSLCRQIPKADQSVREGKWDRTRFSGTEITGKTLGVIGFGAIGRIVCKRALALKMRVVAHDPFVTEEMFSEAGVESLSLDELYLQADIISLHCPLTEKTKALINTDTLKRMKQGARLINCARGALVDENALYESLMNKQLAGAALDVFEHEPPKNSPLLHLDNIQFTPHLGASTLEAQTAVGTEIAHQVATFIKTQEAINAVNLPRIPAQEGERLRPYQDLAQKLGHLLARMMTGTVTHLDIAITGPAVELKTEPITAAALVGLLREQLSNPVNQVNAHHLAKRQGIQISESRSSESHDYLNTLTLIAQGKEETLSLTGTLFDERHPRLVRINDYLMEASLTGHLLFTRHTDVPGVVGDIGALLAHHHINISTMQVGVIPDGQYAIAVIGISNPLNESMMIEIKALPNIDKALQISL